MVIKTLLPETAQPTPAARRREAHTLERRTAFLSAALKQFSINGTSIERMAQADSAVNINMGTLVGSYASIAAMLDEVADVPGCGGVLLTVDDFVGGMDLFGRHIQPLMRSRRHVDAPVLELAE